jgi:hypothetical protein
MFWVSGSDDGIFFSSWYWYCLQLMSWFGVLSVAEIILVQFLILNDHVFKDPGAQQS